MTPVKTILIDNYDSFTYNVYQYLCSQGADVEVYRNDKITVEEIEALNPRNIVISPGPGHPSKDAGISRNVISHFTGKLPILGICMGEQCMFEVFGGTVSYAGDILHGKTSTIKHDSRGIFKGVPQNNQVTRYHSLSGMSNTLPEVLEVTATTDDGVIMAIRHKKYTIEGVQFHPESILCEHGNTMIANFLNLRGGVWEENPQAGVPSMKQSHVPVSKQSPPEPVSQPAGGGVPTILQRIYEQRQKDVEAAKEIPGQSEEDIKKLLALHAAPPMKDFVSRLRQSFPALMAEVKRASPSKGNIDIEANAAEQALKYAIAGASVISVLTEPKWFRGSLNDMRQVRDAIGHLPNRPCILRKDFIVDRYQILEARLYGADTVLLIVAMLSDEKLQELYSFAKSLGIEPLVEVNNAEEMAKANALGAKVIGVNNRNLHSFDVDMETTSRLAEMVPNDTILCALSGISCRKDVKTYESQGVKAVLVGEALMRAWDLSLFVDELLHDKKETPTPSPTVSSSLSQNTLVKICGISSVEAAVKAAQSGADLIGLIFVQNSKRSVTPEKAIEIIQAVRALDPIQESSATEIADTELPTEWFELHRRLLTRRARKPLIVGVFLNQSIEFMTRMATQVGLDMIQLHGTESVELARYLPVPVIKAFHIDSSFDIAQVPELTQPGNHQAVLLDAKIADLPVEQQGGKGKAFDWSIAKSIVEHTSPVPLRGSKQFPVILAGGLDPTNVADAISIVRPFAVDVSSGVETDGKKDLDKIDAFIQAVRSKV